MISADVNSDVMSRTRNKGTGRLAVYIMHSFIRSAFKT